MWHCKIAANVEALTGKYTGEDKTEVLLILKACFHKLCFNLSLFKNMAKIHVACAETLA